MWFFFLFFTHSPGLSKQSNNLQFFTLRFLRESFLRAQCTFSERIWEEVVRERKWCVWMRSLIGAWTLVALRAFFSHFLGIPNYMELYQKNSFSRLGGIFIIKLYKSCAACKNFYEFFTTREKNVFHRHFFTPACAFSYSFNHILN